ncbi:MAG TPA: citrate synthase [Erysipelotrichaceae bacterium]|nr:citrate synthase [Erysipelotrichia bacterium]HPX32607.1 citrate synthase [Erysipelotrichaceae bacterium]HQA85230.1 citrate synthase [Erysipelotrichaceae bacterium]
MNKTILTIFEKYIRENKIPNELYKKYNVKKGLRNEDGTGVLIGLTRIADVVGYARDKKGNKVDIPGELYYRGIPLKTLYEKVSSSNQTGYEEICFLLLFGYLPNKKELTIFKKELRSKYDLPEGYLATNILKAPSIDIMNKIQGALLLLYSYDDNPDDCSVESMLKQGLSIVAKLPAIIVYSYAAKKHLINNQSLLIHPIRHDLCIAESILYLLRGENNYNEEEVKILDLLMVVHADHGAGNNSTFASLVVSSTDTDIYSSFAAAVGSLKGPKHGGANTTCKRMMDEVIKEVGLNASDEEILNIIKRILNKDFFDKKGLVYGLGHAVYTISDPRCVLLKKQATEVAEMSDKIDCFEFYKRFEDIACNYIKEVKGINICANVDFYSGLIYDMLKIPEDLFSPLFVASRAVGWLAHNIEEKINSGRIIRPAGQYVGEIVE